MKEYTPKIVSEEHKKFMKKQDGLPKKLHEFSFTYKTQSSMNNGLKKFLKSFPKKDISYLTKGQHKSYYNSKFHSTIFYELKMTLAVRNTYRVTKMCIVKGFVMGNIEPRKEFPMPSKKVINSNISKIEKREKLYKKELSNLTSTQLRRLKENPKLGDKLIRKLKPKVKESASSIWLDLCELSKEMN